MCWTFLCLVVLPLFCWGSRARATPQPEATWYPWLKDGWMCILPLGFSTTIWNQSASFDTRPKNCPVSLSHHGAILSLFLPPTGSFLWHPEGACAGVQRASRTRARRELFSRKAKRIFVAEQGMLECSRAEEAMAWCLSKSKVYWVDIWSTGSTNNFSWCCSAWVTTAMLYSQYTVQHVNPRPYVGIEPGLRCTVKGKILGCFCLLPLNAGMDPLGLSVLSMYFTTELHPQAQCTGF